MHNNLQTQINLIKVTQTRLIQQEKLATLGKLIAGVAHELNNPLATILLYSQLLQRKLTGLSVQDDLATIASEARRAGNIVQSLLDFSRQRPPERDPIQINDTVNKSLTLLDYTMRTRSIHVETHLTADLPITMADPYQLQQVFINIINNALQAMSQENTAGHRLIVSSACAPPQFPGPRAANEKVIRITIANTGPHIPKETLPRVFDPFFTTKAPGQGTGLGLSVCHGIVSKHGGRIWMESEPDQNTAVHIELPIIAAETRRKQTGPLTSQMSQDAVDFTARILIVDDEKSLRQVLTQAMKREGYHIDALSDADAAFARLRQHDYDLIICDIRMPGINGIEFYQMVKTVHPHLTRRFMFTTGDAVSPDTKTFLAESGISCLIKPFELPVLAKRVRQELMRVAQLNV